MKFSIIEGSIDWIDRCREFYRLASLATYPRPELGITEDLFSRDVYESRRIKEYFIELCTITKDHKLWLAVTDDNQLIGMVAAHKYPEYCDMKAFYVKPELKAHGIGHALYQKVLEFAADQAIQVDVIEYLDETIAMYQHWGFHIDESKGKLNYPITEWPEAARLAYTAIYMVKPASA